jgi:Do/DeqQ family serine protease
MRAVMILSLALILGLAACSPGNAASDTKAGQPIEAAAGAAGNADFGLTQAQPGDRVVPRDRVDMQLSLAPVVQKASPAVVNVYALRISRRRPSLFDEMMRGRGGDMGGMPRQRIEQSLGSGVIVRGDGIVVTNNHVIDGADALKVVLSDRREFDAKLVLADPRTDLAVLRIEGLNGRVPALAFADTRSLQVGDLVIAIGNPFGLNQSVTSGIVSALARTEVGINDFNFFIQTDAAINRGNSGGALVDMRGDLVGINTAIFSEGGGSNGIGFAIPSEMVRRVVEGALADGRVVRPWLGVRAQPVTQEIARSLGMDRPTGVIIAGLTPDSPGARAGLRVGDVLLKIGGVDIVDEGGVRYQTGIQRPGANFPILVARQGRQVTLTARAEAPPRTPAPEPRDIVGQNPLSGVRVVNLSPGLAEELGVDPTLSGVMIQAIDQRGVAFRLGFQPGDIIRSINGQAVRTTADLTALTQSRAQRWRMTVERGGQTVQVDF